MKPRQLLSPSVRAAFFDPPGDAAGIVRHYTFSPEDLVFIGQRRREPNRLGFAVLLAYLRFPGRVLGPEDAPPADMLAYIGGQLGIGADAFSLYAQREETRREHLGELQAYLGVRPFGREDYRTTAKVALEEATGTDRGEALVAAMIGRLREHRVLLPAPAVLERIGLSARARARQQAHQALLAGIDMERRAGLERLLTVDVVRWRTPFSWIRNWPEAPAQKNLDGLIERLQAVRALGIEPDREQRVHRARYAAIARETAILDAQHVSRFDEQRRLATLVVFAREMEALLTDAAIAMFDKLVGGIFRKADNKHKESVVQRAQVLVTTTRALLAMAKTMVAARQAGADPLAAVERSMGWDRLATLVAEADGTMDGAREDNLAEVLDAYPAVRRMTMALLSAFTFRSWKASDPLLAALGALKAMHAAGRRSLPDTVPTAFLSPVWRQLVGSGASLDRRAYELAVMVHLRDRLRAGDVWVEGSRAFRAFDAFLLPTDVFADLRREGELRLSVPDVFHDWRGERLVTLERRLREADDQAARGELPGATIANERLSISPIRRDHSQAADELARRLYGMLPRLRITDLLTEVHGWTGFAERFVHLRTGEPPADIVVLMSAILADATNLGLSRMARSSSGLSHARLLWTAEWHIRDETYTAGLAALVEAIHAEPLSALWGEGDTSSSDGQFFRAGGHGEAGAERNARYGSEPGVRFYTHLSDRFGPYHTKVIAATASEAPYVLDGLLHHETSLSIREHYTDTGGVADYVFGLCHLLGFRFAPRIRDLADRKLIVADQGTRYAMLEPLIGGVVNLRLIEENWDEVLRMAASVRAGTVPPSVLLRKLAAYPRQNALAKALREIG
ncbi:MAG: Tn3 family transposase, partial [Chloroflexi bacterium]|nr:Tn3 family transposase [Chloroflexota bacterium]